MLLPKDFESRVIEREVLDDAPAERAIRSMRDVVRINRFLGGNRVTRRMLDFVGCNEPFSLLDVGAGSGAMSRVIEEHCPQASVVSLDYRVHHLYGAPGN
ncbi:MAG TPA: hypothetical protein VE621_14195, partial [Bryobacteraceae bacterium]|nr:hypothetical protein [Bryobacteraceae bacterium]